MLRLLFAARQAADPEQATAAVADPEHDHDVVATGPARDALSLRPIMQGLASDLAGFSYALWLEDYDEMTSRAAAIAEHAHISSEEIARIEAER